MSAASPTTPPLLHGRYRILAKLGEGRLATVYHAEDERLKRRVIVHLLRTELVNQPNLRQRFEEEARRGAQRSHPGLLEVYDSGEVSGRPYMVTEDIDGQPLAEAGPRSASGALSIVRTIVSAVALAQSQGIPHPPVTSRNVWLLVGNRTILLENWNTSPSEVTLDLAPYRAPERIQGGPPTPASLVYAVGVLAWETFVGRRPFSGASVEAIVQQQRRGELPSISQARPTLFSPELDRIVAQAVANDPQMRYPTPTDFGRALDHYADATTAQTGRLASLPTGATGIQPQPITTNERRPTRLRMPGRRAVATAPAPAVALPPPPPVIAHEPPPQTRTVVTSAAYDRRDLDKQIERSVRREVRRQGCQRTLIKRGLQLVVVFLVLYGGYLGVRYVVDYTTGQIAQLNPGQWLDQQLPDINDFIPSWISQSGELTATYRIVGGDINLRSSPGAQSADNIIRVLSPGTLVQQLGPPQEDPNGGPNRWIQVITLDTNASTGYIALIENRLERQ